MYKGRASQAIIRKLCFASANLQKSGRVSTGDRLGWLPIPQDVKLTNHAKTIRDTMSEVSHD
jgi:hypothetical protein